MFLSERTHKQVPKVPHGSNFQGKYKGKGVGFSTAIWVLLALWQAGLATPCSGCVFKSVQQQGS